MWFSMMANAAVLDVCASGCQYTTIGDALEAAQLADEVQVQPGTYVEALEVSGVTVRSTQGPSMTFLVPPSGSLDTVVLRPGGRLEGFDVSPGGNRAVRVVGDATLSEVRVANGMGQYGVGVHVQEGTATILQSVFEDLTSWNQGGCVHVAPGASLVLEDVQCRNVEAQEGAGFSLNDAESVVFRRVTIEDGLANMVGGALFTNGVNSLVIEDSLVQRATAAESGGAMYLSDVVTLEVSGSRFEDNTGQTGGAIFALAPAGSLEFQDVTFRGNVAVADGGAIWSTAQVSVNGAVFEENMAGGEGGALRLEGLMSVVSLASFVDNVALRGGAMAMFQNPAVVSNSRFMGNAADQAGGGIAAMVGANVEVAHSLFCANEAVEGGGIAVLGASEVEAKNLAMLENTASEKGGALSSAPGAVLEVKHVNFLQNDAPDGGAVSAMDVEATHSVWSGSSGFALSSSTANLDWNAWWDNVPGDVGGGLALGDLGAEAVFADPGLVFSANGNCFDDALHPALSSPLIDAGNPQSTDSDGSRLDIGMFGGVNDDFVDGDGDGAPWILDCDDADPEVAAHREEDCGDGKDNDCDGIVDCEAPGIPQTWFPDGDQDGFGNASGAVEHVVAPPGFVAVGGDCNDEDPNAFPGASEIPDDGRDQDCSGQDAVSSFGVGMRRAEGCACSTERRSRWWSAVLGVLSRR